MTKVFKDFGVDTTGWDDKGEVDHTRVMTAPTREQVLDTAKSLISGDRRQSYGDVAESFTRIATMWSAVLDIEVTPEQVALCLVQLKVSRLCSSPGHRDSWVDICGYGALGAEVNERTVPRRHDDNRQQGG